MAGTPIRNGTDGINVVQTGLMFKMNIYPH
jgi:hypothetical protein